jgi:NAD(P)-dependent dehydrogenase (short-subunit alcohol dehydrogenase family)
MAGTGNGRGMAAGDTGLAGRVVVVTGGASAIGTQIVAGFADADARVVVADLAEPAGDGAGQAAYYRTDITDDAALGHMVDRTVADFGGIDALVNCAAVYKTLGAKVSLTEITNAEWDRVLTVNVRGTWQAIKAVMPAIARRGGGRIVNISSTTARSGTPGFAHYVASKAAVEGLTRAAARELGTKGITVNAIAPGLVDDDATNMLNDRGYVEQAASRRAIPRQMYPSDLVGAARFLASDASSFITGQVLVVDGGTVFA